MRDETLQDRAIKNYNYAVKNFNTFTGDEVELNFIGYSLQQSVELMIKHVLEMNGIRYSHTHAIEDLLDECEANGVPISFSDQFYDFSPSITKWESKTRYIKNFTLSMRQIKSGFRFISEFLKSNGCEGLDEISQIM